jgi:starch phosphorylase
MDDLHATAIYSLLENEIVPMYYQEREEGVPVAWMQRVKQSIMNLSPMFNCQRMLHEYSSRLYEPAHHNWLEVRRDNFQPARERVRWAQDVNAVWHRVHLRDETEGLGQCILSGSPVRLSAAADLAGLTPSDVRVEAVVGHVNPDGILEDTTVLLLNQVDHSDGQYRFSREFVPHQTGRLGYTLRISPNHTDDPLTRPCLTPMKWA